MRKQKILGIGLVLVLTLFLAVPSIPAAGLLSPPSADYNPAEPLIIDPSLIYASYFGGSGGDSIRALGISPQGNIVIAGESSNDAFVAEFSAAGNLLWQTPIVGSGEDIVTGVAFCYSGCPFVVGKTNSPDFPISAGKAVQAYQGGWDGFAVKLSSSDGSIIYSTCIGSTGDDSANAVASEPSNGTHMFITGSIGSTAGDNTFPVTAGALNGTFRGGSSDAFLLAIDPTAVDSEHALLYGTFLGGTAEDEGNGIGLDPYNAILIVGSTASADFQPIQIPANSNLQQTYGGGAHDIFAMRLTSGYSVVYSAFVGGSGDDQASAVCICPLGAPNITGKTNSANFPTTLTFPNQSLSPGYHAYYVRIASDGAGLNNSYIIGGNGEDEGLGITLNSYMDPNAHTIEEAMAANPELGMMYITGVTSSSNLTMRNAIDSSLNSPTDAFVVKVDPFYMMEGRNNDGLVWSTYLGGSGNESGRGIARDNRVVTTKDIWVAGDTSSSDFPTAGNPYQPSLSGATDGFLVRIAETAQTPTLSVSTLAASNITTNSARLNAQLTASGSASVSFQWDSVSHASSGSYTSETPSQSLASTGSFAADLTNLQSGTTHYYRAKGVAGSTTAYGGEKSFTTTAASVLSVTTEDAGSIGSNSARLNGNLVSMGGETACSVSFQLGTAPGSYTSETIAQPVSGAGPFSTNLAGLTPVTTYYYCAKATAGTSTVYGLEKTFTTRAVSSGGGGGGGGGIAPLPAGTTRVSSLVDKDGEFIKDCTASSDDKQVKILISQGTTCMVPNEPKLTQISLKHIDRPPAAPEGCKVLGQVYNLAPDATTFDLPATITFNYLSSQIPKGLDANKLTVACLEDSEWVELDSRVDEANHTCSADILHFSVYALVISARPADCTLSSLDLFADDTGAVTAKAIVVNNGDFAGDFTAELKLGDTVLASQAVNVPGGESKTIVLNTSFTEPRIYSLSIGSLSGSVKIKSPADFVVSNLALSSNEVEVGKDITVTVDVANTGELPGIYKASFELNGAIIESKEITLPGGTGDKISFTLNEDKAGSFTVSVGELTASFTVKTPAVFTIGAFSVDPAEAVSGEDVTVTAEISNTGQLAGVYMAQLKIDNIIFESRAVELTGGASEKLTFVVPKPAPGSYLLSLGEAQASFVVQPESRLWWWLVSGLAVIIAIVLIGILSGRKNYL